MNNRNFALLTLIILGIATRFIPHLPNFTAVGAVALLGGTLFRNGYKAFFLPLAVLFLSDLLLNNVIYGAYYDHFLVLGPDALFVYGAFLLTVLIGRFFTNGFKVLPLALSGLVSTLLFYLITNFGAWLGDPLYPQNFTGLIGSYVAGLPFLGNQLLGMAVYGTVLFGLAWFWIGNRSAVLADA